MHTVSSYLDLGTVPEFPCAPVGTGPMGDIPRIYEIRAFFAYGGRVLLDRLSRHRVKTM